MCATCGCSGDGKAKVTRVDRHDHFHAHGDHDHAHHHPHDHHDHDRHAHDHSHDHGHDHNHDHDHDHGHGSAVVALQQRVLDKNDALAQRNRAWLSGREILMLNLVSSPGSGKTTLLERTIADLKDRHALYVIEGDQATVNDGLRIQAAGAPVVQVNTGTGCHLEAEMVADGLRDLRPGRGALVLVENVGNLVCPALFDLGESAKVVILSVTEGEDKPLKYPHMFRASDIMILNKIDLLPHVDFDVARCIENARAVNPRIEVLSLSARTGEGLEAWYEWLAASAAAQAQSAFALDGARHERAAERHRSMSSDRPLAVE